VYAIKFFGTKKRAVDARVQPTLVTMTNHAEDDESLELVCSYPFLVRASTDRQPSLLQSFLSSTRRCVEFWMRAAGQRSSLAFLKIWAMVRHACSPEMEVVWRSSIPL
jgi:hypothetical protein